MGLPRVSLALTVALAPLLGGGSVSASANRGQSKMGGEIKGISQKQTETWIIPAGVRTEGDKLVYQAYVTCWTGKKPIEAPDPDKPFSSPVQMSGEEQEGTLSIENIPNPEDFCINKKHSEVDGAWKQEFEGIGSGGK